MGYEINLSETEQIIITEYIESKERFKHAQDRYKFFIEKQLKEKANGKKTSFQLTDKIKANYVPPRTYYKRKKDVTEEAVYMRAPDLFEQKTGYEQLRLIVEE